MDCLQSTRTVVWGDVLEDVAEAFSIIDGKVKLIYIYQVCGKLIRNSSVVVSVYIFVIFSPSSTD